MSPLPGIQFCGKRLCCYCVFALLLCLQPGGSAAGSAGTGHAVQHHSHHGHREWGGRLHLTAWCPHLTSQVFRNPGKTMFVSYLYPHYLSAPCFPPPPPHEKKKKSNNTSTTTNKWTTKTALFLWINLALFVCNLYAWDVMGCVCML